jgi:hypothetical protein
MNLRLWGVSVLAVAVSGIPALNYSGYCFEQHRYLADEEIVRAAVERVMGVYPPVVDVVEMVDGQAGILGRLAPMNAVPYASADEFLRINEGCCELRHRDPEGYRPSLYERLTGRSRTLVRLEFAVRYVDRYGNPLSVTDEAFFAISNCGRPWSRY